MSFTGGITVNGTLNVQSWGNQGVVTVNAGGVLSNSVSNLVSGGGSRIYVGSVSTPGGQLNLQGGTSLDLQGSLLVNNGTITGPTNVYYGSLAKGAGTFGAVNVYDGGKFSPRQQSGQRDNRRRNPQQRRPVPCRDQRRLGYGRD